MRKFGFRERKRNYFIKTIYIVLFRSAEYYFKVLITELRHDLPTYSARGA